MEVDEDGVVEDGLEVADDEDELEVLDDEDEADDDADELDEFTGPEHETKPKRVATQSENNCFFAI